MVAPPCDCCLESFRSEVGYSFNCWLLSFRICT